MGDISSPAIKDDATIIELLGWGDVTVTRYESKTIQDETYDNVMCMVYNNPLFALECLDKQIDRFSSEKFTKLRKIHKQASIVFFVDMKACCKKHS